VVGQNLLRQKNLTVLLGVLKKISLMDLTEELALEHRQQLFVHQEEVLYKEQLKNMMDHHGEVEELHLLYEV